MIPESFRFVESDVPGFVAPWPAVPEVRALEADAVAISGSGDWRAWERIKQLIKEVTADLGGNEAYDDLYRHLLEIFEEADP